MNISRIFIERPVATILFTVAIIILGIISWKLLPVSALPEVDYPTIEITTLYPGASPDVMAATVTAPLERQLGQMPGLTQMLSTSSGGASVITLQFDLKLSIDVAEQEVQESINAAGTFLPTDLPMPPLYNKVNPADAPILTLAITSKTITLPKLQDWIETRMMGKISELEGVGEVSLGGSVRPAVRIYVNPGALAIRKLSYEDVRTAVTNNNIKIPKGSFDGVLHSATIDSNDQLHTPSEYQNLIITYQNGAPVRLGDVAEVVDGSEDEHLAAWGDHTPGIIMNIRRQPNSNVVAVGERIKALLPELQKTLPPSVQIDLVSDRTINILNSVHDTQKELLLACFLVVIVIYLFLHQPSATLIPGIALPVSLLGTLCFMYLAHFSINNLTLMALTIATGFVVDDAIVMIENIARFREQGLTPWEAALQGSKQITFTIISLTFSLIAVLIPLLFMGDVMGRLFHEFAITLAVSILISAVVSLTLTPMLCARLKPGTPLKKSGLSFQFHHFIEFLTKQYAKALDWVLDRAPQTFMFSIAILIITLLGYYFIPKGFFPQQDTGLLQIVTEAPQSTSFQAMQREQKKLNEIILSDPAVEHLSAFIGVDGTNMTPNTGRMLITLKPLDQRPSPKSIQAIMARLAQKTQNATLLTTYIQPVQDLTTETQFSRTQYQLTLGSAKAEEVDYWAPKFLSALSQLKPLEAVASNQLTRGTAAYLDIDRDNATRLGVTVATIDNILYDAFGQRIISTLFTDSNQYRIVMDTLPNFTDHPDQLNQIYFPGTGGSQVPFSDVAHLIIKSTPLTVNRLRQFPVVTLSFNLRKGYSLGEAVDLIKKTQSSMGMPDSVMVTFQGIARDFEYSQSSNLWLMVAAILTMYGVLGVLYESYIHPITILSTLPSAGLGALLALWFAGQDLGILAIIGIILLIGIVKKNGIMMVDFALEAQRHSGLDPKQAIRQACLQRFRPILMTTLAAFFAAIPLMLSRGIGAELRIPLGLTLVGGLLVSQILTLLTTPVSYLLFERWTHKKNR